MDVRNTSFLLQTNMFGKNSKFAGGQSANAQASARESILNQISKTDPDAAKQLRGQLSEHDSLLKQLQSSGGGSSAERKEAARQKIERLKAQITALRLMSGGDPKAVAKRAAQLARELKMAAREYSGTGGGDIMSATGTSNNASSVGAVTQSQETVVIQHEPAVIAPDAVAAEAEGADAQVNEATAQADSLARDDGTEDAPESAKERERIGEFIRNEIANIISQGDKALGEKRADDDFKSEVRSLIAQLKIIANGAKKRMGLEGVFNQDARMVERELRDTEKALNDIGNTENTGSLSVSILV